MDRYGVLSALVHSVDLPPANANHLLTYITLCCIAYCTLLYMANKMHVAHPLCDTQAMRVRNGTARGRSEEAQKRGVTDRVWRGPRGTGEVVENGE